MSVGMRRTTNATTAAKRLADALGFKMESVGGQWVLTSPEGHEWDSTMTGSEAMGRMIMIAVAQAGFGLTYPEVWELCHFEARQEPRTGQFILKDKRWTGGEIARMLRSVA